MHMVMAAPLSLGSDLSAVGPDTGRSNDAANELPTDDGSPLTSDPPSEGRWSRTELSLDDLARAAERFNAGYKGEDLYP